MRRCQVVERLVTDLINDKQVRSRRSTRLKLSFALVGCAEQSGRSGRFVGQPSDLFAVGVTPYEIATGVFSFKPNDALQLIHDYVVLAPQTPASIDTNVPPTLSAITRLFEKEPDRLYQGAEGLAYDLIRLRDALARAAAQTLPLAGRDFPSILLAPSRLIGRETERALLRDAFTKALHSPEHFVLNSGSAGLGKALLVDNTLPR